MMKSDVMNIDEIKSRIFTIRGMQVMMDSDIAKFYQTETKYVNRAVKRNPDRFPEGFVYQLTKIEMESLRFQFGTLNAGRGKHRKFMPYVFTEAGVAMLSGVLQTDTSISVSVQIIQEFVNMRHFISENNHIFQRINNVEVKQIESDKKFEILFKALESKQFQPKQGIFFNGQVFDAYRFVSDLIRSAEKSIILIDNFIDDTVLTLFTKRRKGVSLKILTKDVTKQLKLDMKKFNKQYPLVKIQEFSDSHDRFLIIDETDVYHIGASLKDLGRKWFVFSKMNIKIAEILIRTI